MSSEQKPAQADTAITSLNLVYGMGALHAICGERVDFDSLVAEVRCSRKGRAALVDQYRRGFRDGMVNESAREQ